MIPGLLIYAEADIPRASSYIDWLREEGLAQGLRLTLVTAAGLRARGLEAAALDGTPVTKAGEPCFAINRSRDWELAILLELWGLRVFNPSQTALLGNHKLAGYQYAKTRGVPFAGLPARWLDGERVVSKPVCGHGGEGVALLSMQGKEPGTAPEGYLQQSYVRESAGDVRFYVLADRVLCAVLRRAREGFAANYSLGGSCELFNPSAAQMDTVERLTAGLRLDYAGADFLLLRDGTLLFNELEDAVGSRMLSALGINDTTPRLMRHIRRTLAREI